MTTYSRGDVALVGFVFADGTGRKLRPAVVISTPAYHRERQEAIVAAITSNEQRRLFGDHLISDWKAAGLLFPCHGDHSDHQASHDRSETRRGVEGGHGGDRPRTPSFRTSQAA